MYSDVNVDNPNFVFVTYLSDRSIMGGLPDGTFHPDDGLTRAQSAVIIVKAAGLATPTVQTASFKDVAVDYWAANYIETAAKAGYLKGFSDGTFRPDQNLTRAQAISLIMRLSTQKERAALPVFKDMTGKHWAAADMATALQLKMIGASDDGQNIEPEGAISRGGLARALAILLTRETGLTKTDLVGKVTELQGDITLTRGKKTMAVKKDMGIIAGDVINSTAGGRANISYPDGSSTLIEENTQVVFKKSGGRNYIKQDGSPGVAVDYLNIEIKQGTIFGALATKREVDKNPADNKQQAGLNPLFASRTSFDQLAAADAAKSQPWYRTAEQKKVKIKVDMPWGVAAVRGTFYKMTVNIDGSCKVSCLTGNVDLTSINGNLVSLGPNQTSAITSANGLPVPAHTMDKDEIKAFQQEQKWVLETAIEMDLKQEALDINMVIDLRGVKLESDAVKQLITALQTVINALQNSGIQLSQDVKDIVREQLKQIEKNIVNPYEGRDVQSQLQQSSNVNNNNNSPKNDSNGGGGGSSDTLTQYDQAGTYGSEDETAPLALLNVDINAEDIVLRNVRVSGNLTINKPSVTLQNVTIAGNLSLNNGIGEGDVNLINVTTAGNTLVAGGGGSSVHLNGCSLNTVMVDKENNQVRIVAESNTSVGTLTLYSGAILEESGLTGSGFSAVTTSGDIPANAAIILSGNFSSLVINAPDLNIMLESGGIGTVDITAAAANTSLNM
ncbi:MAG: S-layer homology domain-containing protein, partial [Deltaproteobacteria bacterium]